MTPFKRGDVVVYNVRQRSDMQHWKHLNGAIGIVQKSGLHLDEGRGTGALVVWVGQKSKKKSDILDDDKPYPYYLLEKVGHLDGI